jgi:predicted helicase
VIISTTDRWGRNAQEALEGQTLPVQRIGLAEIVDSPINWDIAWPQDKGLTIELSEAVRHEPRPHQAQAIDKVFAGYAAGHTRGKLIMACGTGKTLTALKIAERVAVDSGGSALILFAVPSISLLSPDSCGSGRPSASSTCARSACVPTTRSPVPPRTSTSTTWRSR